MASLLGLGDCTSGALAPRCAQPPPVRWRTDERSDRHSGRPQLAIWTDHDVRNDTPRNSPAGKVRSKICDCLRGARPASGDLFEAQFAGVCPAEADVDNLLFNKHRPVRRSDDRGVSVDLQERLDVLEEVELLVPCGCGCLSHRRSRSAPRLAGRHDQHGARSDVQQALGHASKQQPRERGMSTGADDDHIRARVGGGIGDRVRGATDRSLCDWTVAEIPSLERSALWRSIFALSSPSSAWAGKAAPPLTGSVRSSQ